MYVASIPRKSKKARKDIRAKHTQRTKLARGRLAYAKKREIPMKKRMHCAVSSLSRSRTNDKVKRPEISYLPFYFLTDPSPIS